MKEPTLEEVIEGQIKDGYLDEHLQPLKCIYCENEVFEHINCIYDERGIIELDSQCYSCKKVVGHWAYGSWDI